VRGLSGADATPPEFPAAVATHITPAGPQGALPLPAHPALSGQSEGNSLEIAPPTRSSFMAKWQKVPGATGYRLDVSTDASFDSFVGDYQDFDVGNVTGRVVTGLSQGTTYYYRVRAYDATGALSASSSVTAAATSATVGLNIHAVFDSSITTRPNAAVIEATINRAIAIYESLFADPITIQILFRYTTTAPNGTPLTQGTASLSYFVVYPIPWSTYINALKADAKTKNDFLANASLPGVALSANIGASSADGRAVKLNTPPAMFANGTVAAGGPYDGIVTLSSTAPLQFTRPISSANLDAQTAVEHEMDEV